MQETQLIETIKQLIAIPSTISNPAALQETYEFISELIQKSGKAITIEPFESNGVRSLLAYRGANRPDRFGIILNGHLDVVPGAPEQYQPHIADGKLYGRGVFDMKAAAIVLTDVFCEYVDKVPYALGLQIVTDEEQGGTNGTQYQIEQGVRADFVICGESGRSTGNHEITNEAKGVVLATIEFNGSSAHGAYPWRGDNAAMKAAHFATRLHDRYPTPNEATSETTVTLTSIVTTNDAHNKLPAHAVATIDARYTANDPHFATKQDFAALLREFDSSVTVQAFYDFSRPMYTSPTNPLLLALKAAAERIEGAPFTLVRCNATSDGRHYAGTGGEACEFGIAGENQHGDDEHVPLSAVFDYRETLRGFLAQSIDVTWNGRHAHD
jgi:succinyl-diaminopimelate desuccinylase